MIPKQPVTKIVIRKGVLISVYGLYGSSYARKRSYKRNSASSLAQAERYAKELSEYYHAPIERIDAAT